jgi:hypothetical protein
MKFSTIFKAADFKERGSLQQTVQVQGLGFRHLKL